MIELIQVAHSLQQLLEQEGIPVTFIGGLALQRWGQPRVTDDVDVTLFTDLGGEDTAIALLLSHYNGRGENVAEFAKKARVLLIE